MSNLIAHTHFWGTDLSIHDSFVEVWTLAVGLVLSCSVVLIIYIDLTKRINRKIRTD